MATSLNENGTAAAAADADASDDDAAPPAAARDSELAKAEVAVQVRSLQTLKVKVYAEISNL